MFCVQTDPLKKTFAEFFAGIGLVRAGLLSGGWQCVYANDISPDKAAMYLANCAASEAHYHLADVNDTDAIVRRLTGLPLALATASFPCVDLSLAGHWRGLDGAHSSTFFGFTKVLHRLAEAKPLLVMLENVPGLLTSNGGDDFHRVVVDLASCGYSIDAIVLDARRFVPQSRPRLFIFGFSDALQGMTEHRSEACVDLFGSDLAVPDAMAATSALRPPAVLDALRRATSGCSVAMQPLPEPPPFVCGLASVIDLGGNQDWWGEAATQKHLDMMERPSRERVVEAVKAKRDAVGAAFRRTRRGATRLEVRFDVAGCLRTPKGGSAKQIVIAITGGFLRMRWMSPREYARLQGAADFVISVPPIQAMYGFGDAVCVPAIEWIDRHVLTPRFDAHRRSMSGVDAVSLLI